MTSMEIIINETKKLEGFVYDKKEQGKIPMVKYYVKSGQLERIITAGSPIEACCKAIELSEGETIDEHWFFVDERGFRGDYSGHEPITTEDIPNNLIPIENVIMTVGDDGEDENYPEDW